MGAEANPLTAATGTVLSDIAKHAQTLGNGLQNAAPPSDAGPGKSVLYLTEISTELEAICRVLNGATPASSSTEE